MLLRRSSAGVCSAPAELTTRGARKMMRSSGLPAHAGWMRAAMPVARSRRNGSPSFFSVSTFSAKMPACRNGKLDTLLIWLNLPFTTSSVLFWTHACWDPSFDGMTAKGLRGTLRYFGVKFFLPPKAIWGDPWLHQQVDTYLSSTCFILEDAEGG